MYSHIIGVDTSAREHGIAIYDRTGLISLRNLTTEKLIDTFCYLKPLFVIKSVVRPKTLKTVFQRNQESCYIATQYLINRLQEARLDFVLVKKDSASWGDKKNFFERKTGWILASDKDTRDAAYIAHLEYDRVFGKMAV